MKSISTRRIFWLAAALAVCGAVMAAAQAIVHTTVLSGKVTKAVTVGTTVKEGDTLVEVESLAGSMPAARATADGKVVRVDVAVGDRVEKGGAVAVVETN